MISFSSRKLLFLTMFVMLLLVLPVFCLADYQDDIFVQPALPPEQAELAWQSRILAYQNKSGSYLFLPSRWHSIPLTFHYPNPQTLYLQDVPFASGSVLPAVSPGSDIVLTDEKGVVRHHIQMMEGTGIPSVFVQTESGSMKALDRSKANRESGTLLLYGVDGVLQNDEAIDEIRGRGNSTYNTNFSKRAYQVRLSSSTDLCGMGKARTYNLMADYIDISLLRNRISMDMAKQVGIPYALDSQSVNLFLNNRYNGVYLLTEKIGVNQNRLNIFDLERATEAVNAGTLENYEISRTIAADRSWYVSYNIPNNPPNITGGYILELEYASRVTKLTNGIRTSNGACLVIKEPTCVTAEQAEYIGQIFNRYHRAIMAADGIDPQSGMRYDELIDTDSMALVLILQEYCKNYDHEQGSLFFYKDVDAVSTKVYAGPVWDFDRTYGSVQTGRWLNSPNNMLYKGNKMQHYLYGNVFNKQADFEARVKELYAERYLPALALLLGEREPAAGDALRPLAEYRAEIEPSVRMNFTYWNSFSVKQIVKYSGQSFDTSYDYLLRFLQNRREAMNNNWLQ